MSIELSRRDFMKCSAVAALAVASGTLLTGCGGGGATSGIRPNQPINKNGLAVEMDYYDSPFRIGDFELVEIEFDVKNNSDRPYPIATSAGDVLNDMIRAMRQCWAQGSTKPLKDLESTRNFKVTAEGGEVYAYIAYSSYGWSTLEPGHDADIHLYCAVSAGWKTLNIRYSSLGLNFVQTR